MEFDDPQQVASPCVRICVLDEGLGRCIGCGRTRAEIWKWTRAGDDEKRDIVARARQRITLLKDAGGK